MHPYIHRHHTHCVLDGDIRSLLLYVASYPYIDNVPLHPTVAITIASYVAMFSLIAVIASMIGKCYCVLT